MGHAVVEQCFVSITSMESLCNFARCLIQSFICSLFLAEIILYFCNYRIKSKDICTCYLTCIWAMWVILKGWHRIRETRKLNVMILPPLVHVCQYTLFFYFKLAICSLWHRQTGRRQFQWGSDQGWSDVSGWHTRIQKTLDYMARERTQNGQCHAA